MFWDNVEIYRKQKNLTYRAIAKIMGTVDTTVSSMRQFGTEPRVSDALKIADALGVDVRILAGVENVCCGQRIRAVTFGNFDLLVDGKPLHFKRKRSKEMLAYLIDRHGHSATRREIAAILFEDESYNRGQQNYFGMIAAELKITLEAAGIGEIYVHDTDSFSINANKISCDLYEYEAGEPSALNSFHGEYMAQYSWGEMRIMDLYMIAEKRKQSPE